MKGDIIDGQVQLVQIILDRPTRGQQYVDFEHPCFGCVFFVERIGIGHVQPSGYEGAAGLLISDRQTEVAAAMLSGAEMQPFSELARVLANHFGGDGDGPSVFDGMGPLPQPPETPEFQRWKNDGVRRFKVSALQYFGVRFTAPPPDGSIARLQGWITTPAFEE